MKNKVIKRIFYLLLLIIVGYFLINFTPLIIKVIFSNKSLSNPKSDVEVAYNIGWWSYQDDLNVESLHTEIIDSRLNLFNKKSLVQFRITGSVKGKIKWKPYIKKVHISERYIEVGKDTLRIDTLIFTSRTKYIGDILLVPVIGVKEDDNYKNDALPFDIKIQEIIESSDWGRNTYIISCGNLKDTLFLQQGK